MLRELTVVFWSANEVYGSGVAAEDSKAFRGTLVEFKTPYYTFMDMSSIRYSTAPKN